MKLASKITSLFSLVSILAAAASAQVQKGLPAFTAFGGGPDAVNLANLNVHLSLPIVHKNGRGLPFAYNLNYDGSIWTPLGSSGNQSWVPSANFGFITGPSAWNGQLTYSYSSGCQTYPYVGTICWYTGSNYAYTDASGTVHAFSYWYSCSSGCSYGGSTLAADGSGYTLVPSSGVMDPSGIFVGTGNSGTIRDANGNYISVSTSQSGFVTTNTFTDTINQNPLTINSYAPSNPPTPYAHYGGVNVSYAGYNLRTAFGCSGVAEYGPTMQYLITSIAYPDGTNYTFTYEQTPGYPSGYTTGRIASVTLRTGGTIYYAYPGPNDGILCADGTTAGLTRQAPDGTWSYAHTESGTAWATTITDAQNNQTVMNFQGIYPTQTQVYQGSSTSGTLLKTVYSCYNGTSAPCNSTSISLPITRQTVTIQWPGVGGLQSKTDTTFNSYGLPTETDEYAYGAGATGSVVRKTLTTYATLGNGIMNRPATLTVQDDAGNVRSQTTYTYDQGAVTAPSGTTPQHSSVSGSRGNPTTISYVVSASATLTKTFTYFDTGNVRTETDVNGAQTTYNYPDASSTCGNAFPTSVTEPLSLTRSSVWNCSNGSLASQTDENSATTSYGYSGSGYCFYYPAGCPNGLTDPLGNFTTLSVSQTSSSSSLLFNSGNSTVNGLTTRDALGRTHISQRKQSPSSTTYDSTETDYDVLGRPYKTTLPYAANAGQACSGSCPATTVSYDALSRPTSVTDSGGGTVTYTYSQNDVLVTSGPAPQGENTKRKQLEYDALGRLSSLCELTSGTGSGSCGQTNTQTGYWTKYTYDANSEMTAVSQNAQSSTTQARNYAYDDLGRMTSETNPENGTTSYVHDTDPSCGTSGGDVVKKVDAAGNTICYGHDALHRITSTTYSGTYASVTPNRYFVYDSATVNGVAMSNVKTRIAEAYTCSSPCTTKLTDEGFSYTARGEVSDVYESTPHSGVYYHVSETYWANGVPNQLNGGTNPLPGLPTITYNVDGEGRIASATASSGQNPLSNTTYSVASLPTVVNLGSSDSDSFTYDPNTNRMTQYKFTINSQSVTGNLTWNPLGTLGTLAITDSFNGSNAQTCNYSHDDLARIANANCGSVWSQTFSFDAFGNLQKSGSSSFGATYSTSTNHMTLIGSSTPSYDSNGNVTNDFLHTYAWDANGRPVAADIVGLTYDAFGSMTEQSRSGTYTQVVHAPSGGKLALMNGSALQKGIVTLVGGSMAVYNSSGLDHYRHSDWLGSNRLCSSPSRTVTCDIAYGPYGETYAPSGSSDPSFTGMNQDTVPNLYDFPAREYGTQGRWPSPDPAGIGAVDPSDPQTWNRYAYVRNSPLSLTDPSGMDAMDYYDCEADVAECGGFGFGTFYTLDGVRVSAAVALNALGNLDAAVACPGECEGFLTNKWGITQYEQYHSFAGLASAVDGYYAVWGVGSLSYNQDAAGVAAAKWGAWNLGQTHREAAGSVWCGYGVCSSTIKSVGEPYGMGSGPITFAFDDIPAGTNGAGWWHSSSGTSSSGDLSAIEQANRTKGTHLPLYTGDYGDPGDPVLIYDPSRFGRPGENFECVFVPGTGPVAASIPACGQDF